MFLSKTDYFSQGHKNVLDIIDETDYFERIIATSKQGQELIYSAIKRRTSGKFGEPTTCLLKLALIDV